MVAAVAVGAGNPLPAAGMGLAWTGSRPVPRN
jgi:hypothetical protein